MLEDLNFFDDDMGPVSVASTAEMKKPIARAGTFAWTLRAGVLAVAVTMTPVFGSPASAAVQDGRKNAVAVARAMHRFGVIPADVRRQASTFRKLSTPITDTSDAADPDYGF